MKKKEREKVRKTEREKVREKEREKKIKNMSANFAQLSIQKNINN